MNANAGESPAPGPDAGQSILTPGDQIAAITAHSAGFAAAADGHLDADVPSCPGWTVADLAGHLTEVHWFWATIAAERLAEPPPGSRRPATAPRGQLLAAFRAGADRLAEVLRTADGTAPVWTWAPQRDIAFIRRHQVQEAAVHHWDAVSAAGGRLAIEPPVAADSVEEFLTFSVPTLAAYPEPARPALAGQFGLRATDTGSAWTVRDDQLPGTVRYDRGAPPDLPAVTGTASDLLLWLYGRVTLDTGGVPAALLDRFRALTETD
ncbi:MAG: maleylpyruvate isomerase family mycothiol-dependent enzyme [Streptosporangiales bacterium]